MLSFIISNVLVCTNAVLGITDSIPQHSTIYESTKSQEVQTLKVGQTASIEVAREEFSIELVSEPQVALNSSQIVSQSLPASNSVLINSAMKYMGANWDCTMLVEQALRDLGYSVPDVGPLGFGGYGVVFYDPSQVQAGDIMMRGGHVSIYAGNGMAIHGGFGFGGVVYTDWDSNPAGYSSFVRIG